MGFIANLLMGPVFKTVGKVVGGWLERKQIKAEAATKIELARQEVITAQATADINWDQTMAEASKESWKDEFWTIILAVPAIFAFVPGMTDYILQGFVVLDQMPMYYKGFLGTAIAAAFGRNEVVQLTKRWTNRDLPKPDIPRIERKKAAKEKE
jgi:hypothetical protein